MPYLSILTNARVADVRHSELLAAASRVVASQLCTELTDLIAEFFGIARDRIFLVMVDVDAKLWGHDGKTFG